MTHSMTLIEQVRRNRIRIAVAALAYEVYNMSTMSDGDYDKLSLTVDKQRNIATGNSRLDRFFQRNFNPSTGSWVYSHPDIPGLANIIARYHQKNHRRLTKRRRRA